MSAPDVTPDYEWTVADLDERFGPIPVRRIRQDPAPGTAIEQDVIDIHTHEKRLYELVDGVLVEKTAGFQEAFLATLIGGWIGSFIQRYDLGIAIGANGMCRLGPGLVRIPDVSFIGWDRIPGKKIPALSMIPFAPHLAVEVLSPGNTRQEMQRKLVEYFDCGVALVWYVDPRSRTIRVHTSPENVVTLKEGDTLDGGKVLSGFQLPVAKLFERLERTG